MIGDWWDHGGDASGAVKDACLCYRLGCIEPSVSRSHETLDHLSVL
jgi:hypothetical protein